MSRSQISDICIRSSQKRCIGAHSIMPGSKDSHVVKDRTWTLRKRNEGFRKWEAIINHLAYIGIMRCTHIRDEAIEYGGLSSTQIIWLFSDCRVQLCIFSHFSSFSPGSCHHRSRSLLSLRSDYVSQYCCPCVMNFMILIYPQFRCDWFVFLSWPYSSLFSSPPPYTRRSRAKRSLLRHRHSSLWPWKCGRITTNTLKRTDTTSRSQTVRFTSSFSVFIHTPRSRPRAVLIVTFYSYRNYKNHAKV